MADKRFSYAEELVGANHPFKTDTINRLMLVEHDYDGSHSPFLSKPYELNNQNFEVSSGHYCIITLPQSKTISSTSYSISGDGDLYIKGFTI